MKALRLALFLLLAPLACSHLPTIRPIDDQSQPARAECDSVYAHGEWQFLHAIEATPPAGRKLTILGLSQVSSDRGTLHCVMMTVEGVVMFEADYDGAITIQRTVPPFDKPGMAEGIIDDLKLIFLPPEAPPVATGILETGDRVCRYDLPDQGTQDIVVRDDTHWQIIRYNKGHRPVRTVVPAAAHGTSPQGMANQIVLQAPGLIGYRLKITLLEADPLPRSTKP